MSDITQIIPVIVMLAATTRGFLELLHSPSCGTLASKLISQLLFIDCSIYLENYKVGISVSFNRENP